MPNSSNSYNVCGKLWTVGPKYILHEHVGGGSYGDVCRATDLEMNQIVALKRVPDVLCCPLLAKRVLREVCIMRRLSHQHIISLTDVFVYPSSDIEGGLDLYIATEFADGGDLYHLKEPLSSSDVKVLIWQLLSAFKYLHSCHVWHRDIKSENILLTSRMHAKICDFGLSRSAEEAASGFELGKISTAAAGKIFIRKALTRQYTKMVVTPCYRAPEVIMSRGEYDSTIDIWSLGCIFWELLIRSVNQQFRGPLANPLFGVRGEPVTPEAGEKYAKDSHTPLAEQLNVIFNVIGTPCWKDIQSIPSETWREYLKELPGRAGNLAKDMAGLVEDDAIDLLLRMLAFDPARRCTAEEALMHVYFKGIKNSSDVKQSLSDNPIAALTNGSLWKIKDPSIALELLERELDASERDQDGGRNKLIMLLDSEIREQKEQNDFKRSVLYSLAAQNHQLLQKNVPNCRIGAQVLNPNTDQRPASSTSSQQEENSTYKSRNKKIIFLQEPPHVNAVSKLSKEVISSCTNHTSQDQAIRISTKRELRRDTPKVDSDGFSKQHVVDINDRRISDRKSFPRRSPRIRYDLPGLPLAKRTRLQS